MCIVGFLQRHEEIHIDDLSKHFDTSKVQMRALLSTLNTTSFMPRNSEEQLPYFIDLDRVDEEDGIVKLILDEGPKGVPRITGPQSAAILSGLAYLRSIPDFEDSRDLAELIDLLSTDQPLAKEVAFQASQMDGDIKAIKRGILSDKRISCRYVNSKGEESIRQIDPLLLVSNENVWYLRGYCLKHKAVRTFRLDHMVDAEVLTENRSTEALEAAKNLDETAPIYNPSANDVEVELELGPEAYKLATLVSKVKEPTKLGGEKILVTIRLGYLPDLGALVCRFGNSVKVVGPQAAREVVRKFAELSLTAHKFEEAE